MRAVKKYKIESYLESNSHARIQGVNGIERKSVKKGERELSKAAPYLLIERPNKKITGSTSMKSGGGSKGMKGKNTKARSL